jgi:hypothetical protein
MADATTTGAVSGGASGAAVGTQIMPGWGTLIGGIAGAGMGMIGGMGADRAARRAKQLRDMQRGAQKQMSSLEKKANAEAQKRLQGLAAERYRNYGTLAAQLGGPERTAAGQAAGVDFQSRLGSALGGMDMAPVGNRGLVGGAASAVPINAQLDPVTAARRAALEQGRIQGGLSRFDTQALQQQQTGNVDIGRRAQEEAMRQSALAEIRRMMLAQAGVKYADRGPNSGEQNQMMLSQLGLAGMQVAGGIAQQRNEARNDELFRKDLALRYPR